MKTRLKKLNQGFTIIEVMIVLAIAGLILAIVFIAVPQLQRNARDNQRQNIVTRVKAEIETYASNSQGTYPFAAPNTCPTTGTGGSTGQLEDFCRRYLSTVDRRNPTTGGDYTLSFAALDTTNPTADQILIHRGATCSGEGATGTGASATTKKYALRVSLDRGNTFFCVDNG